MPPKALTLLGLTLAMMLLGSDLSAVPITYMVAQQPTRIAWAPSSFPISFTANSGSPLIARNQAEVRAAFADWQVPSSTVRFKELPARTVSAGHDGINAVTTVDGLFKNSGMVAFTNWWYDDSTGLLEEADIQIDPAAVNDQNFRRVVEHEAGHLLGLDHSGNLASTMYPFVGSGVLPLAPDDVHGIAALYPGASFSSAGSIDGTVKSAAGAIFGAQVVAVDEDGSPVATALTNRDGQYEINGLPQGNYRIYAEPLDGPVDERNLSGIYANASNRFHTTFSVAPIGVSPGGVARAQNLQVDGAAPGLNPRWVGAFPAGSKDMSLSSMAARVMSGSTMVVSIGGDGVIAGKTTFSIDSPLVKRVSDFQYGAGYMSATFQIGATTTYTPLNVIARNDGESAALTGALLVEPRAGRGRPVR